jgi:thiol-disulfide isomerase/thioredoxin
MNRCKRCGGCKNGGASRRENFRELHTPRLIKSKDEIRGKKAFVMVYADWCGHCRVAKPEFLKLSHETVMPVLVNSDQSPMLASEAGAMGFPHFAYFDGENFETFRGPRNVEAWKEFILQKSNV